MKLNFLGLIFGLNIDHENSSMLSGNLNGVESAFCTLADFRQPVPFSYFLVPNLFLVVFHGDSGNYSITGIIDNYLISSKLVPMVVFFEEKVFFYNYFAFFRL